MNAKTILSLTVLGAVTAASAAVTSANTLCRIEVDSPLNETMLAVPLIEVGGSSQTIAVTNMVMTSTLSAGDILMYNTGSEWYSWVLNDGKKWVATETSDAGKMTKAAPNATFARGRGVWLVRKSTASKIYLYGQVDSKTTDTTAAAGTSETPAYTLMGNPKETGFNPNSVTWSDCAEGDMLAYADSYGKARTVTWKGDTKKWCTFKKDSTSGVYNWAPVTAIDLTIPAGQGFWYVSRGGAGQATW